MPWRILPDNMAWSAETPESISPTVMPAPLRSRQARSGRSPVSAHGSSASGSVTTGPQFLGGAAEAGTAGTAGPTITRAASSAAVATRPMVVCAGRAAGRAREDGIGRSLGDIVRLGSATLASAVACHAAGAIDGTQSGRARWYREPPGGQWPSWSAGGYRAGMRAGPPAWNPANSVEWALWRYLSADDTAGFLQVLCTADLFL